MRPEDRRRATLVPTASAVALSGALAVVAFVMMSPPAAGQEPDAPGPEEVRFHNGELTLAGLWFTPEGEGPFPAAVFIRGSGPSSRDSYWGRAFVGVLNDAGVAVLFPDKRGSDGSEGDWRTADFDALAADALAGVEFVRGRADVRPESVGLVGLSQGGKIAPVAAARSGNVAWVVNVVGASVPLREQVNWEMYHTFREAGVEGGELQDALALQVAADTYLQGELEWPEYRRLLDRGLESSWASVAEGFPSEPDAWRWDFFRGVIDFDPLTHWKRTRQPVLVFYGEDDHNAPAVRSAYRLIRAFRETGHPDATVRVIPDAGHALWDPDSPNPHQPSLHPDVVRTLGAWLRERR